MNDDTPHGVVSNAGRPTIYKDELADDICFRIASGRSLNDVCGDVDMPNKATVYRWIDSNELFCDKYREATSHRADFHFDEMLDISDKTMTDAVDVAAAKLKIDTRKWILSRMNPTKYGDKQQIDNVSSDKSMTPTAPNYSGLTDDELRQYIALESKAASTTSGVGKP